MAFQDFNQITERRRVSNEQKFRRRVLIAVAAAVALLAVVGAGVFAVAHLGHHGSSSATATAAQEGQADKVVRLLCNATDYKDKCEETLSKGASSGSSPREFLVTAIEAARTELRSAFNETSRWKFATEAEKGAFEDCEVLMEDALEELEASVATVGGNSSSGSGTITDKVPDLNSWLSAVISYQQSCVDGFPEGKTKEDMAKLFRASKEFTSNSLALVTEVYSLLSAFQMAGVTTLRHLLEEDAVVTAPAPTPEAELADAPRGWSWDLAPAPAPESELELELASAPAPAPRPSVVSIDDAGFPEWMEEDDRRMLKVKDDKPTPNVTVAKDGSGQFKTINEALAVIPLRHKGRFVIYVKEGIYEETVIITKKMWNVTLYGDGSQKSIITGSKNFVDGVRTFLTATFAALGEGFIGKSMGFRNTAGPEKHQAVAARVQSDRAIFLNCRFEGYQDTLYAQTHRQFYRSCVISGTVDFIFGDAAAVLQNCLMVVRRPLDNQQNIVTAQGRTDRQQTTGLVLHSCRILADKKLEPVKDRIRSYLGRPWKEFSRTVVMESTIGDVISPAGWLPWEADFALSTLYYAEYRNKGPGAILDKRVNWPGYKKQITKEEASQYTVENFLLGGWLNNVTGVPVRFSFYES